MAKFLTHLKSMMIIIVMCACNAGSVSKPRNGNVTKRLMGFISLKKNYVNFVKFKGF